MHNVLRAVACLVAVLAVAVSAWAQSNFVRLESVWKAGEQIHVESGTPATSATQPGWHSADWLLEPAGSGQVRIKNRWKGTYLHLESGTLGIGPIQPGWQSALWNTETVSEGVLRFRNAWKGTYLNIEKGTLEASAARPEWLSAQWRVKGGAGGAAVAGATAGAAANSAVGQAILAATGRQCVKAPFGIGYAAKVRWYDPELVVYEPVTKALSLREGAKTTKEESIAVGQSSCIDSSKKMFAQVTVIGGDIANQAITIATGTAVAIASGVVGAVVCVGTAGAGCPAAAAGIGAAVSGAVTAASVALPDAKTTFYLGAPGTLEIGGTVWAPTSTEARQFGQGKAANAACNSDNECGNNTCAYGTAAAGAAAVCCPSGEKTLYAGYNYCTRMSKGATCWSDAMCASGGCQGNMSGLQRGTCR